MRRILTQHSRPRAHADIDADIDARIAATAKFPSLSYRGLIRPHAGDAGSNPVGGDLE